MSNLTKETKEEIKDSELQNSTDITESTDTAKSKKNRLIKRILLAILIVIILFLATPFLSPKTRMLYAGTWENKSGILSFKPLFKFTYINEGAGSPVADSDIRPNYIFLGDRFFLTFGIGKELGKVITVNDRELLLRFNGSTMMFANKNHKDFDANSSAFLSVYDDSKCETRCDKCNDPLYNADMYAYSTGVKNNRISICPWKVYGDDNRKEYSSTYTLASSLKCTYITYSSELTMTDEIHSHKCKVDSISNSDALAMLKDSSCQVFVNFTSSGKIKKLIILKGASTIVDTGK